MALVIIRASERVNRNGIKLQVWGGAGIGKTSLLHTENAETTLALDFEAGLNAVRSWNGDSLEMLTWDEARDIACLIGGPNPARRPDEPYSEAHYRYLLDNKYGDPAGYDRYRLLFVDSTTVAARIAFHWCKGQPRAFTDKGKPDIRGAYGLLKEELVEWFTQLQHAKNRDIVWVGGIHEKENAYKQKVWAPMIDGGAANALPYIVDEVVTMAEIQGADGSFRAFVCHTMNPWGYPAKTRAGLDLLEEPHLGRLLDKIRSQKPITPDGGQLTYAIAALPPAGTP